MFVYKRPPVLLVRVVYMLSFWAS